MRFHLGLPTDRVRQAAEFVTADAIAELAHAAETAGFAGVFVTDHPFPDDAWMRSGLGHHALDPFVALSFAAAATSHVTLMTCMCIVAYRNPFMTAKAALSVHVLSGGRLVLGVSTGYLEPEFRALGVDFDERNLLADEALVAIRRAWTEDGVAMTGLHFDAAGNTMLPHPAPLPAMWVGGNSKRAIRRAVDLADGWVPMPYPRHDANPRRSAFLEHTDELRALLAYADDYRVRQGSTRPLTVSIKPLVPSGPGTPGFDVARLLDHLGELHDLGIDDILVHCPGSDRAGSLDRIAEFGGRVIDAT